MAAYAALVSLMHIIEQIQHHPCPPISLHKDQVQSLSEKVTFLQEFLEVYSHVHNEEADGLQSRIREAAREAEDVIESHIVDRILAQSTTHGERISSTVDFSQGLQKVIQDMHLIKKEVIEIQEKMGLVQDIQQLKSSSIPIVVSSRSPSKGQNIIVGLDDVLIQLMDKLTGQQSNRQIIPIVGMGGIGKTTLARNAYENPLIVHHFDIRAWVTISQEYNVKEILLETLSCQKNKENKVKLSGKSEDELGEMLYKGLCGRRYLIIMDDMWSIEAWNNLKFFFPHNNNGSRVIITTRLSNIALQLPSAYVLEMNFLDQESSWNLLCKIVFGEDGCPLELEGIGKKIAQNCKGLPLSIVVIGGLLAKSKQTREYWKDVAENLNSIVNLEDNERCFKLLYTSYNHLPVHLKSCFLYMGVFREDSKIRVSDLIKLWVVEGFLKPITGKSLEEVAAEYLNDLVDRNLILVLEWKYNGRMKFCKIHDLVRDLCLIEAEKENFLCVTKRDGYGNFPQGTNVKRHIAIHVSTSEEEENKYYLPQIYDASQSLSLVRSLVWEYPIALAYLNFRLLRVLKASTYVSLNNNFFQRVNLRYLVVDYLDLVDIDGRTLIKVGGPYYSHRPPFNISVDLFDYSKIPSSLYRLWNLQTLIIRDYRSTIEIWKMPLLRHVEFYGLCLPDPSNNLSSYCLGMFDEQDDFVLRNLQTLSNVLNFKCSEKIVKMIPNIKKLRISYNEIFKGSRYCLNNLGRLHKLESLSCNFLSSPPSRIDLIQNLTFPHSLKKLTLEGCRLHWEDISTKIGSLPLLQVLKLRKHSFIGLEWETVEDQFLSLKGLHIESCSDLERWTTDKTHFPSLEILVLKDLYKLKEIPLCIGEVPTLQSIELHNCSNSAVNSSKEIVLEQEELGNESLQVRVELRDKNQVLESLARHNSELNLKPIALYNDPTKVPSKEWFGGLFEVGMNFSSQCVYI